MNDDSEPGGGSPRLATGEILAVSAVSCFPAGSPRSSPEPAVSSSAANRTPKLDLSGLPAVEGNEGVEDLAGDNGCLPGGLAAQGAAEGLPGTVLTDTRGDALSNGETAGGAHQEAACLSPSAKKVMIIEQEKARSGTGQQDSPASLPSSGSSRRGSCLRDGKNKRSAGVPEDCPPNPQRKSTDPKSDNRGDRAGSVMTVQSETRGSKRVEPSVDANRKHSRSSAYRRLSSRNSDSSPRQLLRESLSKQRSSKSIGRETPENSRRTPTKTSGKRKSSCSKRWAKSNSRTRTNVGQPGGGAGSEDEADSADEDEGSVIEETELEDRQAGDENQTREKAFAAPQETPKNAEPVEIELELGKDDIRNTDDSELRYNMRTGKFSKVILPKPGLAPGNRSGQEQPADQSEWIFPWEVRRDIDVFALSASAFDRRQRNSVWDKPGDLPGSGQHSAGHGSPPKTFLQRFHHKEVEDVRHLDDVLKEGKTDFFYECLRKMSEANEWSQLMDLNCVYRAFKSRDGRLACHVYDGKSYIKRLPIEVSWTEPAQRGILDTF